MNAATIAIIGQLVAEALAAGASFQQIMRAAGDTGKVPPEVWDQINAGIDMNADDFLNQGT